MGMATPADRNIRKRECEKTDEYQGLKELE